MSEPASSDLDALLRDGSTLLDGDVKLAEQVASALKTLYGSDASDEHETGRTSGNLESQ
jgi:hypothetical protein